MQGSPIAVTYCDLIEDDRYEVKNQVVCQSIQDARYGKEVAISLDNCKCRGGAYFLGLIDRPKEAHKFWVDVEKAYANRCTSMAALRHNPEPPMQLGKYVTLAPIDKCNKLPDLISFVCNVEQGAALLGLNAFFNGRTPKIYSYAAACSSAIGIPMTTGELHVSFIDNSARKIADFNPSELIITIPALKIRGLSDSIEHCIWGNCNVPYLKEEKQLKGNWKINS
ncbi:hypothetical protein CLBCK_02300 [Clostridium beijerinckii]|uniref:DUF169 domain-containing protein n=2 Tax=Clostridium beijerinckii TaxID=1520 RepID=A0A1S8SKR0_CLOBE|nr:hypothetical protein CLBCK_02300 [Clostridium beijerinckii]